MSDFLSQFDFTPLDGDFGPDFFTPDNVRLVVRGEGCGTLVVYDAALRRRMELAVDTSQGYQSRRGAEYPVGGLQVLRVWVGEELRERCLDEAEVVIRARA